MLTPFVCISVHFVKPLTLDRFSREQPKSWSNYALGNVMIKKKNTHSLEVSVHTVTLIFVVYSQKVLMWIPL